MFNQNNDPKNEMSEFYNLFKTFQCSIVECERDFSLMNNICTDHHLRLIINNIANLMFINFDRPSINTWNPEDYAKRWLVKHRCTKDNRSKIVKSNI